MAAVVLRAAQWWLYAGEGFVAPHVLTARGAEQDQSFHYFACFTHRTVLLAVGHSFLLRHDGNSTHEYYSGGWLPVIVGLMEETA
jgi:hypothetical protein